MVANLYPEKRHTEVVNALDKINALGDFEMSLDIYGASNQDSYSRSIEHVVEQLDFVTLKGGTPLSPSHLRTFDFAILASRHEGFGNVIIEYVQAGLPFISSNTDGVGQMVGSDSILLLPDHPQSWYEAVIDFMKNPDQICREMERLQNFLVHQPSFIQKFKDVLDSHFGA